MTHTKKGYYRHEYEFNYIYHANNVYAPSFTLLQDSKDSYELPIGGWYWFNNPEEACEFFALDIEEHLYLIDDPELENPDVI